MRHTGGQQNSQIFSGHALPQFTNVHHTVHHLCHTEAMPEVVERIVSVVFLNTEL